MGGEKGEGEWEIDRVDGDMSRERSRSRGGKGGDWERGRTKLSVIQLEKCSFLLRLGP